MSTGNINLDILLNSLKESIAGDHCRDAAIASIRQRYSSLSDREAEEICCLLAAASAIDSNDCAELVVTAPPSFSIKAKSTLNTVQQMLNSAQKSITIMDILYQDTLMI